MRISVPTTYWITGLPGAGKTTIGKLFFECLQGKKMPVIFLDGDQLRAVLDANQSFYAEEDRRKLAMQYAKLCKLIVDQGINVICATVSMFHTVHAWNRENIDNYCEIYLKVRKDILFKRDKNNLYSQAFNNTQKNIVGFDVPFEEPLNPTVLMVNDGMVSPQNIVTELVKKLNL